MNKSYLTLNTSDRAGGASLRRSLRAFLVGLLALAGLAMAAPAASQASESFRAQIGGNWVTIGGGTNVDLGAIKTGTSVDQRFQMYSNTFETSNRTRRGQFHFSNTHFTYISNCSGTSYSWTNETPNGFTMGKRHSAFSSSFDCQFTARLKTDVPPGTYQTTLTWTNIERFTSGSAIISYTIGDPTISITGPGGQTGSLSFGDVAVGDAASRNITIRNTSPFPLTGMTRAISGSGDVTIQGTTCGAALAPNTECNVTIRYSPSAVGSASASLNVGSTSDHGGTFDFTGNGVPAVADLTVTPSSHDYGDLAAGFPRKATYTVANTGNTTLDLSMAASGGTDPARVYRDGGTCGATLGVGLSCTVIYAFDVDPGGPAAQSGEFTVTGTSPFVGSPVSQAVSVTATRVPADPDYEVRLGGTEVSEVDFGAVSVGGTANRVITIHNTGNMTMPNLVPSITGPEAGSYSISANSCGSPIERDTSCSFTITVTADRTEVRRATLHLTPGAASPQFEAKQVKLTSQPVGLQVRNDVNDNYQWTFQQKRWLETPTINPGGASPADVVRVAFEVDVGKATDIEGVEIGGATTTGDSPPSTTYQNITDLLGGSVEIERKPGSTQALVTAAVPLSVTNLGTGNGQYGFSNGTDLSGVCLFGGDYDTDDRRLWFRVRGSGGVLTPPLGSRIRFVNQVYACPSNQGPGMMGQRIAKINGNNVSGNTTSAIVQKNDQVSLQFTTRGHGAPALGGDPGTYHSINWRLRNAKTGDLYTWNGNNYQPCSRPCGDDGPYQDGTSRIYFDNGNGRTGQEEITVPAIPSRGRWIVEGSLRGTDQDLHRFYMLGVLRINDTSPNSPSVAFGGSLGARPDTDEDYTITANVSDPADPVNPLDSQGGRVQVIEWDLDGDPNNGPLGDGFELRSEGDSTTGLNPADLTQPFSTVGKAPGPYTIRARVTDNGSLLATENASQTRIYEFHTTINTPPEPMEDVVYLEADQSQPADVEFRVDDVDGDDYRVSITPDGANTGSLGGNMNGPIGDNTKPYSWPADYTGTDTYQFTPTDDHKGTGSSGTLTVRVRPNTTIDDATIPGTLHHPDLADPAKRFLGSTTETEAAFEFSSPQSPVVAYECRHLLDGDVLDDWSECSDQSTGDIQLEDLDDGLHRLEVRAINDEGVEDGTPAFRTWRVDNTVPETEVFEAPHSNLPNQQPRLTKDTTPTYKFRATAAERSLQEYMTYECRVMWGPQSGVWMPCGVPSDVDSSAAIDIVGGTNPDFGIDLPLPEGDYEIQVRATDEVGLLGPVMTELLTVDTTPPETALASGPEGLINTRELNYVLGSSQGQSTFLCKVEGQNVGVVIPLGPCPSSLPDGSRPTFTVPADDIYTLTAVAVDPADNQDPTPLEVEFEVDATEPETTMDNLVDYVDGNGPTALRRTQSRKVDVTFTGTDSRKLQGFQCRLDSNDDEAWQLCQSVERFSGLSDGDHRLEIRARDEAGNFDSTPEVLEWAVDRTPPVTTFTVAPDPVTNDADPAFGFEADEAISGSVCTLDGGTPVSCGASFTLADLGAPGGVDDGMHQVTVRSTDIAGNVEATVASVSWRQDTVTPEVEFTSKPGAYTPVGEVEFGWSVKDGDPLAAAPEVSAQCAFDPADPDAIDPSEWESCGRDLTISEADNVNGPHSLSVRAIDEAGNVSAVKRHDWTVLGAKPNPPVIDDSSPVDGQTTRVGTAYFAISHELENTGALDGLFCSIDGGTQTRCEGNYSVEGLADGPHTFSVVARDIGNNVSDPTVISWEVQRGAPVTSIDFGPSGAANSADATFQFSSDKPGTFECKVDDGDWEECSSPVDLINLSEGAHAFRVRAVNTVAPVGIKDPTPPAREWTVDTVAPEISIGSAPEGDVTSYEAKVTFSSDDSTASFQCQLNDGLFESCDSPWNLSGLSAGQQTVTVRAIDPAGNVSAEPESRTWNVLDPVCENGFEGTPPDCTKIPPVDPATDILAESVGGTLSLASLGSVDLPEDQIRLEGKRGDDGRWFVPADGIKFLPIEQELEMSPGTVATVTISIGASGDAWGTLPNGGGAARIKMPVRADVQASVAGVSLLPEGTECSLRPVVFDLVGTFDEGAMTAHLEQSSVAFPKVTGCGSFKQLIDEQLELPRDDIEFAVDLKLTEQAKCPDGQTGTPPNCGATDPVITIAKPVIKTGKNLKPGKKASYRVLVTNKGDAAASGAKVCLRTPKRFFKGKAKRCKKAPTIAPGATAKVTFKVKAKKFKAKKRQKVKVQAIVNYKDGSGAAKTVKGKRVQKTVVKKVKGKGKARSLAGSSAGKAGE